MKTVEIIMRVICFCMGVLLAFGIRIEVRDAGAAEVFANALYALVYLGSIVALLVLPWAIPLRDW